MYNDEARERLHICRLPRFTHEEAVLTSRIVTYYRGCRLSHKTALGIPNETVISLKESLVEFCTEMLRVLDEVAHCRADKELLVLSAKRAIESALFMKIDPHSGQ